MMKTNDTRLIGNIGGDAEVKTMDSGKGLITFSFATSDQFINEAGDKVKHTDWHNCQIWRQKAEQAEKLAGMLTKGKRLAIDGRVRYHSFSKDINGEEVRFKTAYILIDGFLFLSKLDDNKNNSVEPAGSDAPVEP